MLLPLVLWNRKATQKILNETHNRSRFTFLFEQAALERIKTRAQPPHTGAGWFWLTAKPLPAFRVMIRNRFGSVRAIHKSTCKIRVTFTCNSISRYHGARTLVVFFFYFSCVTRMRKGICILILRCRMYLTIVSGQMVVWHEGFVPSCLVIYLHWLLPIKSVTLVLLKTVVLIKQMFSPTQTLERKAQTNLM